MTADKKPLASWTTLTELEAEYWRIVQEVSRARHVFLDTTPNRGVVIQDALEKGERWTALKIIELLPEQERRPFLSYLVHFASMDITDLLLVRNLILSLDHRWLLVNAEPLIWSELGADTTDEQFGRLSELAAEIDADLLARIVDRALSHDDPDIREVGSRFKR